MDSVISLASVLILTVLILYLSYLFTRSLGKGIGMKRGGTYMQMLDRLPLGQDKAVAIVRTGSHYYLIGIASSQITLLAELSEEDIQKEVSAPSVWTGAEGYENFRKILKKYTDRHRKDV
ncbi:flagellar biosynthetic protein FliO [Clostridium sp. Marseille-P2415]|uniref:flagellar biosynthetic protein FliO n=1 Tax=Clostridium sp. Marseille-P2415 TaxID=1805471 RepID=UPI00098859A3|nr:flagellar biosynthetic protein FliO [Clostridium sp. Marseille-P2415]